MEQYVVDFTYINSCFVFNEVVEKYMRKKNKKAPEKLFAVLTSRLKIRLIKIWNNELFVVVVLSSSSGTMAVMKGKGEKK